MTTSLKWYQPLFSFELETTGLSMRDDRIVELGWLQLGPDGTRCAGVWRMYPARPTPAAASAIRGITDADVADCPQFDELADAIANRFAA